MSIPLYHVHLLSHVSHRSWTISLMYLQYCWKLVVLRRIHCCHNVSMLAPKSRSPTSGQHYISPSCSSVLTCLRDMSFKSQLDQAWVLWDESGDECIQLWGASVVIPGVRDMVKEVEIVTVLQRNTTHSLPAYSTLRYHWSWRVRLLYKRQLGHNSRRQRGTWSQFSFNIWYWYAPGDGLRWENSLVCPPTAIWELKIPAKREHLRYKSRGVNDQIASIDHNCVVSP